MSVYLGEWSSESEMLDDFGVGKNVLDGFEVIVAAYDCPDYEGSAYVLLQKDGDFYEVHGEHCSCYGLCESPLSGEETQWDPEVVPVDALKRRFKGRAWSAERMAAAHVRKAIEQ